MTDQHIKEVLLAFFVLMQSGTRLVQYALPYLGFWLTALALLTAAETS